MKYGPRNLVEQVTAVVVVRVYASPKFRARESAAAAIEGQTLLLKTVIPIFQLQH